MPSLSLEQVADLADLHAGDARVVHHRREEHLATGRWRPSFVNTRVKRQVHPARRGVDVEIRQHLLALDEDVEDALAGPALQ